MTKLVFIVTVIHVWETGPEVQYSKVYASSKEEEAWKNFIYNVKQYMRNSKEFSSMLTSIEKHGGENGPRFLSHFSVKDAIIGKTVSVKAAEMEF